MADRVIIKIEEDGTTEIPNIVNTSSNKTSAIKLEVGDDLDIKLDLNELNAKVDVENELSTSRDSFEDAWLPQHGIEDSTEKTTSVNVVNPEPIIAKVDDEMVGACKFYRCMICATQSKQYLLKSYERIHYHLELEHEMSTLKLRENLIECDHDETDIQDIHCRECGERFVNSELLYRHIVEHRVKKPLNAIHQPTCLVCDYFCTSVRGIHQHVLKVHRIIKAEDRVRFIFSRLITASEKRADEIVNYLHKTCRHCGKCCSSEKAMNAHMYKAHSIDTEERFSCAKCDLTFPSPSGLTNHVRTKHPSSQITYICWVCFDKLSSEEIREHFETHKCSLR